MSKTRNTITSRIIAIILTIVPIVLFCVFDFVLFTSNGATPTISSDKTLLKTFLDLFKKGNEKLAFLPLLNGISGVSGLSKIINLATSLGLYLIPLCMLLTIIFMIVGICSRKSARKMGKAIAFLNTLVYSIYAIAVYCLAQYYSLKIEYASLPIYILAGVIGVSFIVYFIYSCIKLKGKAWINLLLLILTIGFSGMLIYAYSYKEGVQEAIQTLAANKEKYKFFEKFAIASLSTRNVFLYGVMAFAVISTLAYFFSLIRLSTKKGYTFDLVRYIINLVVAIIIVLAAFTDSTLKSLDFGIFKLWAILTAVCALLQMIICIIVLKSLKKKKANTNTEEAFSEFAEGEQTSIPLPENDAADMPENDATDINDNIEVAEAVHYDVVTEPENDDVVQEEIDFSAQEEPLAIVENTTPQVDETIESVESANEGEPTEIENTLNNESNESSITNEITEPVETNIVAPSPAGYDYYNSKSFDPFIASLNDEERKDFTEIFILKYKGETKNLPDYVVGGDNADFFRKVFIFLGQYRAIIPSSLLQKMYRFASRKQ